MVETMADSGAGYPRIADPGEQEHQQQRQQRQQPDQAGPPAGVVICYGDEKAEVDVSAAVSVADVQYTVLSIFKLPRNARVLVKRVSDGAVVVPGPKLPPGEYVLEEVDTPWKVAYKSLRDQHYPKARKELQEKHIPFMVSKSKETYQGAGQAFVRAQEKAGAAFGAAGGHISRAAGSAGAQLNSAGATVRGHVQTATSRANTHTTTNPHTWTAKLWASLCSCAPGPISYLTGIPAEQLPTNREPAELLAESEYTPNAVSETVPLSKNAEGIPSS